jgi:hypothetical protein
VFALKSSMPKRWPWLAAALGASLLGHAWLLGALPEGLGRRQPDAAVPAQAVTVRSIVLARPAPVLAVAAAPATVPEAVRAATAQRAMAAAAPRAAQAAPVAAPEPISSSVVPELEPLHPAPILSDAVPTPHLSDAVPEPRLSDAVPEPNNNAVPDAASAPAAATTGAAAAPASAPAAAAELPVYATHVPPSARLRYDLRRGMISGTGELLWQLQPSGDYELRLEGKIAFVRVLTQLSQGRLDSAGLAPTRFTDQRQSKPVQAANFQREQGVLSFSGPAATFALRPGLQDRLSWMVQLPAIVAANPLLAQTGATITLGVAGVGGSLDTWVFRAEGPDTVETALGPVQALRYTRVPRQPYDTTVEAWLDPARHHLPVHARLTDAKFSLDFVLEAWTSPP